jgi:hypothetical protein
MPGRRGSCQNQIPRVQHHRLMAEDSPDDRGQLILYATDDGQTRVECRFQDESLWLSLNQIADLFGRDKSVISKHLKAIFEEGELDRGSTVANYATVQIEGSREVSRDVDYYNIEAILAVGYRVRSPRGIQFRKWATAQLREFLTKGFVMDDERLKNPESSAYFDQLLERISDIRSSEKVFWRKVCETATSTPPASTTMARPRLAKTSLPRLKTRCTGPPTGTPPPRSFIFVPMPISRAWVSRTRAVANHASPRSPSPRIT